MGELCDVMRDISDSVENQNVKRSKDSKVCAYVDTKGNKHSLKNWVRGLEI